MEAIEEVKSAVLKSPKYRHVMPELVAHLAEKELAKREKVKEATKAVKNKLHQIGGHTSKNSRITGSCSRE